MADKKVTREALKNLRQYSLRELPNLLLEKSEELFRYRMQHKTGSLSQKHLLKTTRRDIARIKTLMKEYAASPQNQEKKDGQ